MFVVSSLRSALSLGSISSRSLAKSSLLSSLTRSARSYAQVLDSIPKPGDEHYGVKHPDYDKFLSKRGRLYGPSAIRALQPLVSSPGMISLGGGMPNPDLFPFAGLQLRLKSGETIDVDETLLRQALQYSPSDGLPELRDFLLNFQAFYHGHPQDVSPPRAVCVTNGSQDGIAKAMEMFLDEDDSLLLENPTYSGTLAALRPLQCNLVGVATDHEGLDPAHLRSILESWPQEKKKPKVLYLIPTGQNPSGSSLSDRRRMDVYFLAREHDLLILEDDPYFFLQFADWSERYLSLMSLDVDGRVIRFDSFSKVISGGMRLGWVTGPKTLVDRIQFQEQATNLHASGLSQAVLLSLIDHWGAERLHEHLDKVANAYRERRDLCVRLSEKYLTGLAEWRVPQAGMFLWYKIPGVEDTDKLIMEEALKNKVLMVPGGAFNPEGKATSYVRAAFSTASEQDMEEAIKRFAGLLRTEKDRKR